MGAFSAWVDGVRLDAPSGTNAPVCPRTVVLADYEPPSGYLARVLGRVPSTVALTAPPERPEPGVRYGTYRTATNPIVWDDTIEEAFARGVTTVAMLMPPEEIRGRTLLALHRRGVRRVVFVANGRIRRVPPLVLAAWREFQSMGRRAGRLLRAEVSPPNEGACRAIITDAPPLRSASLRPLRIAHFVCSLNSGGAERQVCHAAILQKRAGHDVRILTRLSLVGEDGHYRSLIAPHDIPARRAGSGWSRTFEDAWARLGLRRRAIRALPRELAVQVADLVGELLTDPVDVLHCYVDDCNIPGGVAAALTGTPVVLSFRNGNPTHFPGLARPWMRPWYLALRDRPGVVFSSNSEMGAGLRGLARPAGRQRPGRPQRLLASTPAECRGGRRMAPAHGIDPAAPLVAGVFRLQPEKRPLYFLACVRRIREALPGLRVALAGVGSLGGAVREAIARNGLGESVLYLGQVSDVPKLLAASDVHLLTSDWEGTPNIVLEAQHFGCVPVATDAGGSREAMLPNESGILVGLHDPEEACRAVVGLLTDPGRRAAMRARGRDFVTSAFAPSALLEGNARLYARALDIKRG